MGKETLVRIIQVMLLKNIYNGQRFNNFARDM